MSYRTRLCVIVLASAALGGCIVEPGEPGDEMIDSTESALTNASQPPKNPGQVAPGDLIKGGMRAGDQLGTGLGEVMNTDDPNIPKPQPDPWGDPSAPSPVGNK